jgi:CBS domain-containing protein
MRTLAVGEMMSTNPVVCCINDNIVDVAKLIKKHKISSVVVCDNGILKGLITVHDIVRKIVASNLDLEKTKVKDFMTKDVVSVEPTLSLEKVIDVMNSNNISQVPVIQNKKVMGFVTVKDILKLEPALFEFFTDRLHSASIDRKRFIKKYTDLDEEDI